MVRQVAEFDTADDLDFYPESDGKPMAENTIQFRWIVVIKEGLEALFASALNVFVAGDLLWYPVKGNKRIKCAPDAMVVFGVPKGDRGAYVQHREGNVAPQVVFEVLSPGNRKAEMLRKFNFYQKYGVEEYYLYDPYKNILQGWLRSNRILQPITNINNWTSPRLQIKFVLTSTTLEIYDPNGEKFLTPTILKQERDLERQLRQQAEQLANSERQARFDAARQLLGMGMSVEQVAQILSLTKEEVEQTM